MISIEKLKILTPLLKLPKNVGDFGKLIVAYGFEKLVTLISTTSFGPFSLIWGVHNRRNIKWVLSSDYFVVHYYHNKLDADVAAVTIDANVAFVTVIVVKVDSMLLL